MILTVLTTFFSYVITGNFRHNKPANPVAVYLTSNYFLPKKYWTANNWHLDLLWTQWSLEIKSKSEHLAEFQRSDFHQSTLQIYSIIIISAWTSKSIARPGMVKWLNLWRSVSTRKNIKQISMFTLHSVWTYRNYGIWFSICWWRGDRWFLSSGSYPTISGVPKNQSAKTMF